LSRFFTGFSAPAGKKAAVKKAAAKKTVGKKAGAEKPVKKRDKPVGKRAGTTYAAAPDGADGRVARPAADGDGAPGTTPAAQP